MAPKRSSPAVVKSSPNKKKVKKEKAAPPAPVPVPALTVSGNPLEPEQIELADKTFKYLKRDKMVILVGKDGEPGCAKTMVGGEATHKYIQLKARARRTKRSARDILSHEHRVRAAHR